MTQEASSIGTDQVRQDVPGPWFMTYNKALYKHTNLYFLVPWPEREFCGQSLWEDHKVIAHYLIEPIAKQAGFNSAEEYIQYRIKISARRGNFCYSCPAFKDCRPFG